MKNHAPKHDNLLPAFWPDSELHRRLRSITRALNRQHSKAEHRELTDYAKELKEELHARLFL
jgi:hypothetical protein